MRFASIAQLDRASDYESEGRGFKSLWTRYETRLPHGRRVFCMETTGWLNLVDDRTRECLVVAPAFSRRAGSVDAVLDEAAQLTR